MLSEENTVSAYDHTGPVFQTNLSFTVAFFTFFSFSFFIVSYKSMPPSSNCTILCKPSRLSADLSEEAICPSLIILLFNGLSLLKCNVCH